MTEVKTILFELLQKHSSNYEESSVREIVVDDLNVDDFLEEAETLLKVIDNKTTTDTCDHPRDKRTYIGGGYLRCGVCGLEFK